MRIYEFIVQEFHNCGMSTVEVWDPMQGPPPTNTALPSLSELTAMSVRFYYYNVFRYEPNEVHVLCVLVVGRTNAAVT